VPDKKEELVRIVGAENVLDDPETLDAYSRDESFAPSIKARLVVKPGNREEAEKVIRWANETNTPLVPVSSGGPHFHGDTVPSVGGAVILNLSRMKRIIRVNRRNRVTIVEPGVTFSELIPELAKEGLKLSMPLLPRHNKSVLACFLGREPILVPRYHWELTEPLRSLEVIWGNGERLVTGDAGDHGALEKQWRNGLAQVCAMGPFQVDYHRILSAAQGTMGIATWAAIKCEILPQLHKLFFIQSQRLDDLLDFAYRILRIRYGDELLILNGSSLASILSESPDQIETLRTEMPPWVLILGIAGRDWLPEDRVEFQEKDITDIAQQFGLQLLSAIPGARDGEILKLLYSPSKEPYWKLRYKGGCQDIFFLATLDKTPEFTDTMYSVAEAWGYPTSDIGIYIQPVVQGTGCHCEFNLPFNSDNHKELNRVRGFLTAASEAFLKQGAFFSRPYGIWAEMAYNRDAQTTMALRKAKDIFDPNNVMNPGKLCF